ncbi:hypothetical protein [Ekhidna sp.]|uniref:hypothetical protein n=1 Tax=Ekhidna sp. TaxID=2608089 RepID=UPI003B506399
MKKLFTLLLLLIAAISYAQESVILSKNQLIINISPLALSYEGKVDDTKSFAISGGLGYAFNFEASREAGMEGSFITAPITYGSFRNYYARKKVKNNNLKTNSGNYFGLFASNQFEPLERFSSAFPETILESSHVFTFGPVWGIQRNYVSGLHLGLSFGPGLKMGKYIDDSFTIVGRFEIRFLLISK